MFEFQKTSNLPEKKMEAKMIENSKLTPEEMEIVIKELPAEVLGEKKEIVAEWIPPKLEGTESPGAGASYLAILKIGEKEKVRYAAIEVLLSGSLHISCSTKKLKEEGATSLLDSFINIFSGKEPASVDTKSTVRLFENLGELLRPLHLTDAFRLRLGEKLVPIVMKELNLQEKESREILRVGRPHDMPPPHREITGVHTPPPTLRP